MGDISMAGVGKMTGEIVTVPGLAFNSDPGRSKSINLGLCPEKLGLELFGTILVSSNKLLKLLVTASASNLGRGSSRI